jgi:hypothetical protein
VKSIATPETLSTIDAPPSLAWPAEHTNPVRRLALLLDLFGLVR